MIWQDQDIPNIDRDLELMPQDLRHDLATAALNDLYLYAKGVLGYRDMAWACHGSMCHYLDNHPSRFKLLLIPRGHYKTSVATISRQLQRVCRDVNSRQLLANETSTNAERFLSAIKGHVESNKRFRALYSSVIPKDTRRTRWSQKELVFNREWQGPEPTIDTIGMTGAWTSRHYTHITFDDPISEEAAKSDLVMHDTITRIGKVFSLMCDVEVDTFDLIGTRWAFFDVYAYMMNWLGPKLARFIRGAVEDGVPIFPEKFSLETLADIRSAPDMGEYLFSCQYMNNPRNPELQDFNVEDIRYWRYSSDESHVVLYEPDGEIKSVVSVGQLDVTCCVDLAPAESTTSDRNAITVCGSTPDGDLLVLHVWAKRTSPHGVIQELFNVKRRFDPRVFGIESVAYQKAFKYFLRAEAARQGLYLNVVEIKATGKKQVRIRGLQPIAATGHLYVHPTQHILRNELSDYPLGDHDDTADSLSMHLQVLRGILGADRWKRYKAAERQLLADIDGYGIKSDKRRALDRDPEDLEEAPAESTIELPL